jgi:hypothetical protein
MLCVKPTPPGVLRAGAGGCLWRFYAQHALSLEGNSKAALSVLDCVSHFIFPKVRPFLHANQKHEAKPNLRAAVSASGI